MLYQVKLTIDYAYEAPSDHTRNLLRLLPCDLPGEQRVLARLLTIEPKPDERRDCLDFFGNAATSVAWHGPIGAVAFHVDAKVERFAPPAPLDFSPRLSALAAEIAAAQSLAPSAPHHYLGASPRVAPMPETTAFARDLLTPGMTALEAVLAIGRALNAEMAFDAEATDVDTSPREAFAQRRGVCQDFTHVMIAALRGIGIPAGYVSGFLRTFAPPGKPKLEGADAMHAWVQAWVGQDMGWVEFDPTNNQPAGVDYITIGSGRDYSDVAPVRGALRSAGGHESKQAVDVIPLEEA
ncbi:MAG: transglutaminase domain-containing protein [Paenirhodobacter sp.]|uniref:transglutaminase family protein n=1 Tax=Paenirhodobacter sp. TaxID=1965326 RepID=UPI003D0EEF65